MSTRANIIVTFGATELYLYMHHDGYVAGCGVIIANTLQKAKNPSDFVRKMLSVKYNGRPVLEMTSDWHGDIEYAYRVDFEPFNTKNVHVGFRHIDFGLGRERYIQTLDAKAFVMDQAADFCKFAKDEEKRMEARIKALEASRKVG